MEAKEWATEVSNENDRKTRQNADDKLTVELATAAFVADARAGSKTHPIELINRAQVLVKNMRDRGLLD